MADKKHRKASDNLDKAFGYERMSSGDDSALGVRDTGVFSYKPPAERPLKQKSWRENPGGNPANRLKINETGSVDKYAKGGLVKDFAKGGRALPRAKHSWGK